MRLTELLNDNSGDSFVYKIQHINKKVCYIGSSYNIDIRIKTHLSDLKKNKHPSKNMQDDFNEGGEDVFYWEILRRYKEIDEAKKSETEFLKLCNPEYNNSGKILRATFTEADLLLNKIEELSKQIVQINGFIKENFPLYMVDYPKYNVKKLQATTRGKLIPTAKVFGVKTHYVRSVMLGKKKDLKIINYLLEISKNNDRNLRLKTL